MRNTSIVRDCESRHNKGETIFSRCAISIRLGTYQPISNTRNYHNCEKTAFRACYFVQVSAPQALHRNCRFCSQNWSSRHWHRMPVTVYSPPAVVIEQLRFLANRRVIRSMLGFGRSALSGYLYFPARVYLLLLLYIFRTRADRRTR